jgi:YegS/Rv2252/BmrU family lipid kinase
MEQRKARKIFLIVNSHAGHRKGMVASRKAGTLLRNQGYEVEIKYTERPGHATEIAGLASVQGYGPVVAVGGDGTVNEVARGLAGTDTPMGIIPVGSGNGLARELGISKKWRKCCSILTGGTDILLDVGKVNNLHFFCTSGFGFNGRIAGKMDGSVRRGFLKYIGLVIRESLTYKPFPVRLTIGGTTVENRVFMVAFANASQFGNNAFVAPGASMTDGHLDVVMTGSFHKLWLPVAALALFTKRFNKLPFVKSYRADRILVESAGGSEFHFDGEPGKLVFPAEVVVDAVKLKVRVPGEHCL